jgi:N-acetylmuramoyl-L-alanine amidase
MPSKSLTSARDPHRVGLGVARGLAATMPVLLVGTMAMSTLNLSSPAPTTRARTNSANPHRSGAVTLVTSVDAASGASAGGRAASGEIEVESVVPSTYTVRSGDTVSAIAGRYGLSTASVLALNGLSWKSLIFPRQVLRLSSKTAPTPAGAKPTSAPSATLSSSVTARYRIVSGDTVTSIARKFGVTVQAILSANGLAASSIIYAGRTLIIPEPTKLASAAPPPTHGSTGTAPAQVGGETVVLSSSMAANAKVIIAVGKARGVPSFGIVVALSAAMQESGLEDLDYGDRDSVGLFQQRPSAGWGTVAQLENPTYAAELFYGGRDNPNKGKTRGLLDIPGWQSMTVTQAAQAVQISATPNAYAHWEASARAWLARLG